MTDTMMGVITLNEEAEVLRELTLHRPLAAVPFGGRYRLIDCRTDSFSCRRRNSRTNPPRRRATWPFSGRTWII